MLEIPFTWPPSHMSPQRHLPTDAQCLHLSPFVPSRDRSYICNRSKGHTGRHAYVWTHTHGVVRAVWEPTDG